jgi:hypothetical protein
MSFDFSSLITDRTQADVSRVEQIATNMKAGTASEAELAEWNTASLKGSYNATDLNRVGAAMQAVANRFNSFGYVVSVSPKSNWTETDVPNTAEIALYLSDLTTLRGVLAVMRSTPEVPADMEGLTYEEANNIEKILEDINLLLTRCAQAWYYSEDVSSGEV